MTDELEGGPDPAQNPRPQAAAKTLGSRSATLRWDPADYRWESHPGRHPRLAAALAWLEYRFYGWLMAGPARDAEPAGRGIGRDRRYEPRRPYAWIRVGGVWRSGFVVAWFRQDACWCCWVQHDHPEGRPWPMFEMYVYDPETIVPRDPWDASTPSLNLLPAGRTGPEMAPPSAGHGDQGELTTAALDGSERSFETRRCA